MRSVAWEREVPNTTVVLGSRMKLSSTAEANKQGKKLRGKISKDYRRATAELRSVSTPTQHDNTCKNRIYIREEVGKEFFRSTLDQNKNRLTYRALTLSRTVEQHWSQNLKPTKTM